MSRIGRGFAHATLATRAAAARVWPRRPYNVLRVELAGDLAESESELSRLRTLGGRQPPADLLNVLALLRSAREDPELGLVLLDVHEVSAGWSRLQTLRRALGALRAAGKRVWAFLPQPTTRDYYLATAAERVFLSPSALFDVTGIASEVVFVKGALDKLGIEAQLARAGRFKSAAEIFTRTDMSDEHRAMLGELLDDLYAQIVADIAAGRGLDEAAIRAALENGPLLAADALAQRLVDALAYPDEIEEALEASFGDPAPIDLAGYRKRRAVALRRAALGGTRVGLLSVSGAIGLGESAFTGGANRMGSWRAFRRELGAMAGDRRLAAIVLRIDSPGGSGIASDLMWREIVRARERKPVLVSMGDVAASGGYYLAVAAEDVTAEAGTLTGSIGVLAGKPVLRGFYERIGISKELVVRGNAARHSDYVRLDERDLGRLRDEAEAFYGHFVDRVATGRGLAPASVEAAAEGRVWTGRQALARGLVDRLGGLEAAVAAVRRRLGLAPGVPVLLDRRPRSRPLWQLALGRRLPGLAAEPLAWIAPLLAGERLLAVMPFALRFLPAPATEETFPARLAELAGGEPISAGVVRRLRRLAAGWGSGPPLVL